MHQLLLTMSLIFSLLACPFWCSECRVPDVANTADSAKPTSDAAPGSRGCSCCHTTKTQESRSVPERPEHETDCSCANCICHGATKSGTTLLPPAFVECVLTPGSHPSVHDLDCSAQQLRTVRTEAAVDSEDRPAALALRQAWLI